MPPLDNPKHEIFAQGRAKGLTADEAYQEAGYKANRGNAARLNANESIVKRIEEITAAGAERAEIDVERVLRELGRIGFQDPRKLFTSQGGILDPQEWDDDTAASIAGIEVVRRDSGERDEDGRPVMEHVHKIKTWDKVSALEKIGKHLKMFTDVIDHKGSFNVSIGGNDQDL